MYDEVSSRVKNKFSFSREYFVAIRFYNVWYLLVITDIREGISYVISVLIFQVVMLGLNPDGGP